MQDQRFGIGFGFGAPYGFYGRRPFHPFIFPFFGVPFFPPPFYHRPFYPRPYYPYYW